MLRILASIDMVESKNLSDIQIISYLFTELYPAIKDIFYELLNYSHSRDITKHKSALFGGTMVRFNVTIKVTTDTKLLVKNMR